MMNTNIKSRMLIPIVHSFDNNYSLPDAVSFFSMMYYANKNYDYRLYILHTDITVENQKKLADVISNFPNASIKFYSMNNKLQDIWENISIKGHYSKEMLYKLLLPSLFLKYDKVIMTDVDVVFQSDISESFFAINTNTSTELIAGVKPVGKILHVYDAYKLDFSKIEITKLSSICGGYLVLNLKQLRIKNIEQLFIKTLKEKSKYLRQAEQDIINLVCYPHFKYLPLKYCLCTYTYELYKDDSDFVFNDNYSKEEIKEAMNSPCQIHYAAFMKPWTHPWMTKADVFFKFLVKTPYLQDYLLRLKPMNTTIRKNIFNLVLPYSKNKKLSFELNKYKLNQ